MDIKTAKANPFSRIRERVNLSYKRPHFSFSLASIFKFAAVISAGLYLIFGFAFAPVYFHNISAVAAENSEEERAELEKQLLELEDQISKYESTVSSYKKQGKTLQAEIDRLNTKMKKINLQIKAVESSISNLDKEININKEQVVSTENDLNFNKQALSKSLQNIYEKGDEGLLEIVLKNPKFSHFIDDLNSFVILQDSLRVAVDKIEQLRESLLEAQEQLAIKKSDAIALRSYHDSQKDTLVSSKSEKSQLLSITRGQESRYQELLKETKRTAAQIRSQIFQFLGGGELSFEKAYELAKVAEAATGVRAALILAVLDKESALGQNVGRCSYKTAMHPKRDIPIFLALVGELGINPDTIMVSCANRDGAYGGAMGPAQFIPSTWRLYAARVSDITGNKPSSPWRNADAFVGTALYLKDAGATKGSTLSEERQAAARYYAGSRWRSYLWTYGDRVVSKARKFQQDIDILNSL